MAEPTTIQVDITDLAVGQTRPVEIAGRKILVCNAAGKFFAIAERCTHAAHSLAGGRLAGFEIECPLHGARFDVRDGSPTRRPALEALETYRLEFHDGRATILMNEGLAREDSPAS
ncbi:MAG: non-heme iron oxygenase ferredoxin subunit [Myxococcota bacterium]